ncbi:hypothetical protein T439DRAFT_358494 [Meredithblackwellia eburnea MCA 4105]
MLVLRVRLTSTANPAPEPSSMGWWPSIWLSLFLLEVFSILTGTILCPLLALPSYQELFIGILSRFVIDAIVLLALHHDQKLFNYKAWSSETRTLARILQILNLLLAIQFPFEAQTSGLPVVDGFFITLLTLDQ